MVRMYAMSITDSFKPDYTVNEIFAEITRIASTYKGLRVEIPMPGTLVLVNRRCPGWAVLLGLLGLVVLIGLLFFFVRTEDRVTVVGRDVDGGSTYSVSGITVKEIGEWLVRQFPQP